MLDNFNLLVQRDPQNALLVASEQWKQALFQVEVISPENDGREIKNIVSTGMGGSALAAKIRLLMLNCQQAFNHEWR